MTSTKLRDMLVKQEPHTSNCCFVCAGSRAEYLIFSKPNGNHPYFPFLDHHHQPEEAENIGPDGSVFVCLVCYSFLTQQWDSYERTKTPQSKRIYWLKRLDNGPYAGMEHNLQQDYESLFESSQISGDHEHHEKGKRNRSQVVSSSEVGKHGAKYFDQTDSRDSGMCNYQNRNETLDSKSGSSSSALDLSVTSRTPQPSAAVISTSACSDVCFVCGHETRSLFNVFAKVVNNCPYFPALLYHQKPQNAKPMDANGMVYVCEHCHKSLLQQWDYNQFHRIPHHERSYQLRVMSNTIISNKKELPAKDNNFICFTCGMLTSTTAQRVVNSYPQKEGDPYFSFIENITPHPGANPLTDGKACVCSVCYKSLFRQLRVFELSGMPEEKRKYKILNESSPEEFSVLRQHLKTGSTPQKQLLSSNECYTCGKQMDMSYNLDTLPQHDMFFPFIRTLIKPPNAKPMDNQGRVKVCGQCHSTLRYQWEAFEQAQIPVTQRQYKIMGYHLDSNSIQYAKNTNTQPSNLTMHIHPSANVEELSSQFSKKNLLHEMCFLCGRLLTAESVHVIDTLPQKETMHFPFIRGLIKPDTEKFVDQFGKVLTCNHCHLSLKSQWDLFESAHVPHSQRQYKVFPSNSEKDMHTSNNMLVRNASAALHVQVSSPDFKVDLNKLQSNLEPLLTTVSTLAMPNIITSNAVISNSVVSSHSPITSDYKLSQVRLQSKPSIEDYCHSLRISGPLDVPLSRPLLIVASSCFVCGEYNPSGHAYAIHSSPMTTPGLMEKIPDNKTIPFFPFLSKHVPPENSEKLMEDGSALVCTFCYHSLSSQWLAYETSPLLEDSNRWHRRYNTYHYVCYICGITTYRKRVCSISVRDFPFLVEHSRPPGALTLHNGECVVTCLTCFESITSQWKDFERMKVPVEMRKYNWIVTPPPPDDEKNRGCHVVGGQEPSSMPPGMPGSNDEHAHFEQRPPSNFEDMGLPHGSKPPPPPHLSMQPSYVPAKPLNRSVTSTVSPIHQVQSHANNVFSPFNNNANPVLSATRTSSFAAALRKLAKQAVDPIAEKELSPISPVSSPALNQQSSTQKRHGPPSLYLNNHNQTIISAASPPLVSVAPTHTHANHMGEKRKVLDMSRYSSNVNSSNHSEPVSLKMDSKSSHSEKRSDHLHGTKHTPCHQQGSSSHSSLSSSQPEPPTSSRGFQPYRSADEIHHSIPSHIYDPPSGVSGYPYHSAFMPTSHLSHPPYRLDESLYLERYGLLRPPIMPFPSSAGMLPHPSVPLYPGSHYPPELLTQPVGLVSPRSSAFNQERLKQEEGRLKENEVMHEREREIHQERERELYQDRERELREREMEEASRGERNHSCRSPISYNLHSKGESPGSQVISHGTLRDLVSRKSSSPISSVPLNLATHSNQVVMKPSQQKETELWYTRQHISNGQDFDQSYRENSTNNSPYRHSLSAGHNQGQVPGQYAKFSSSGIDKNDSVISYPKASNQNHTSVRDYHSVPMNESLQINSSPAPVVHINGIIPREKLLHRDSPYEVWDHHRSSHERHCVGTTDTPPTKIMPDVKNGSFQSLEHWRNEPLPERSLRFMQNEIHHDIPKNHQSMTNFMNFKHGTESVQNNQLHSRLKEASLTRALLQNHITPSLVESYVNAHREHPSSSVSKLDAKEAKIRKARLDGSIGDSDEIESDSEEEDSVKLKTFLLITKGPTLKFESNPKKLSFLQSCGLVSQQKRQAIEIKKFIKRRRLFRERSCSPSNEKGKEVQPAPFDPHRLSELSKRLCLQEDIKEKSEFFQSLDIIKTTREEKIEIEKIWTVVQEEKSRRNGITKPSQRCIELQGPYHRSRGHTSGEQKRQNCKSAEICKSNGIILSSAMAIDAGNERKGHGVESNSGRILSSFLRPPSKSVTAPVPPLIPSSKVSASSYSVDQKESKQVVVLSQDPRVRQLKDFAHEFHESVLQTTQMQLDAVFTEKKTIQSNQVADVPEPLSEQSEKSDREPVCHRSILRWPGIEAIMESYECHITEQNLEKEFLSERCQQLQAINQESNLQIECLGQKTAELLQKKQQLEAEGQCLQRALEYLKSLIQQVR